MRLLFLTEDARGPSTRYRVLQFLPRLQERGIAFETAVVPSDRSGRRALFERAGDFDRVVLQRRLVHPFDFRVLRRRARFLVFDFDDAILYPDSFRGKRRSFTRWIRFLQTASSADRVVAGSPILAEIAVRFHRKVSVLPTVVDVARYPRRDLDSETRKPPVLVWIGSASTIGYLEAILPALENAAAEVPGLRLRVIADAAPAVRGLPIDFVPFREETEVEDLGQGSIGLAPLRDDRWSRGKCGLKLLQYFASGAAAVASPHGVQANLVSDGETGRLASTASEWTSRVVELARDPGARMRIAAAARARVEREYSLETWADRWVEAMAGISRAKEEREG